MNNKKIKIGKYQYYVLFGLMSLGIGNILGDLPTDISIINFLSGMFTGLSIPLTLFGIVKISRRQKAV